MEIFCLKFHNEVKGFTRGKVYVKQNLKDKQIDVKDIQKMISNGNKNLADKIMRYSEGIHGSRQFWIARNY